MYEVAPIFDLDRRLPPQNIDVEEAILGILMRFPGAIERVVDILAPEAFYPKSHQVTYRAILDLYHQGRACDLTQVLGRLSETNQLEAAGGQKRLFQLIEPVLGDVSVDQYAEIVVEKWQRRKMLQVGAEIQQRAYDPNSSVTDLLDASEKDLHAIARHRQSDMTPLSDVIVDVYVEIDQAMATTKVPGIASGFYDLDAHLSGGFQPGELIILGGRPGMMKTSLALNICRNIAAIHRLPVAFFSLEMGKKQLTYRLLSAETNVEAGRLRAGKLTDREMEAVGTANTLLSEIPLYQDDRRDISVSEIRSKCRALQSRSRDGKLGLVVIDYLQLLGGGSAEHRVRELGQITKGLRAMAGELDVPVVALSQLNRSVEGQANKRPNLSHLRESGDIENDADIVAMLYRDDYYNPESPDRGLAEINIEKNRNGPTGTIKLLCEPQFFRFKNLASRR